MRLALPFGVGPTEGRLAQGQGDPHSVYDQPDTQSVHAQFDKLLGTIDETLPKATTTSTRPRTDPGLHRLSYDLWRQIWSNNPNERLNREIRRRTDVVGILPTEIP